MKEPKDKNYSFTVDESFKEKTIAHAMKKLLDGHSWSSVKSFIIQGCVTVNGERVFKADHRLKGNEMVCVDAGKKETVSAAKGEKEKAIEIVYCDRHVVVINKPAGITTIRHPQEREEFGSKARFLPDTVAEKLPRLIERHEGKKHRRGTSIPVKAVHRLDKETSGLLVFARTDKAASVLGKQFRDHSIQRTYNAIVVGDIPSQTIKTWIARDRGDGMRGSCSEQLGKKAITHVKVLEQLKGFTLVECSLETGRTHQIRVHLAEKGHPVCGEQVYIKRFKQKSLVDGSHSRSLALHAAELGFIHPETQKQVHFTAPVPHSFQTLLRSCRG